jgi:hypothetical protein
MPLLGSHPSKGSVLRQPLRIYENGDAKCRFLRFRGPGEDSFANVIALANPGAGFLESWSAQDHWELAAPALCASVHRPTSDLGLDQIVARNQMFFFDPPGRSCRAFSFVELASRGPLIFSGRVLRNTRGLHDRSAGNLPPARTAVLGGPAL